MFSQAAGGATTAAPPRRSPASVRAITIAVGRLLADYVGQLRDDLRFSDGTHDAVEALDGTADAGTRVKREQEEDEEVADLGRVPVDVAAAATSPTLKSSTSAADAEALDEAAPLTDADVAECRQRLQRMRRVHQLLAEFASNDAKRGRGYGPTGASADGLPSSWRTDEATEAVDAVDVSCDTVRRNPVLMLALRRLDSVVQHFQGTASPSQVESVSQTHTEQTTTLSVNACGIQPFLMPVSLAEGALSAFSRNVGVVFRKRPASAAAPGAGTSSATPGKRPREGASRATSQTAPAAAAANAWVALGTQQRRRRFALYTARTALLPRVNVVCTPLYVSPAVHELARLNAEAERHMLLRVWCVHTKAHLLRELPSVARDVEAHQVALREALQGLPGRRQEALLADVSHLTVVHCDAGVVRVGVQGALVLDLTYDLRRRQWSLLALHWLLATSRAAASLVTPALASLEDAAASFDDGGALVQLVPHDREALHGFLQRAFAEGGLSEGLQAAGRLVCATVMDAFAAQLLALQQSFFTGAGLGRLLELEVRPGTFVSFHLAAPSLFCAAAPTAHVKARVAGGTVLLECVWGTDVATRGGGGGATPLVRFSILYQLRHHATSLTARNSSGSPRTSSHHTPLRPTDHRQPGSSSPVRSDIFASSPEVAGPSYASAAPLAGGHAGGTIDRFPAPPLLSTLDKRELSKVVVRDAVFARVLDLVPSRQHVQTVVWTLSPQVIQIDGAVTVCVMPRDASVLANSHGYSPYLAASHGGSALPDVRGTCELVRERVEELTADARLFACLLQPYLGEVGCQGDIVHASVTVEVAR